MLLSFLEQELLQKINSYYYLFHFSLVCLLMFCPQEKLIFLDERISCLKTKKQIKEESSSVMEGVSWGREMKANLLLTEEALSVQLHVHKIKAAASTFHITVHFTSHPR